MSIYQRVLAYYRPFIWPTLGGMALTAVAIGFNLLKAWPVPLVLGKVLPAAVKGDTSIAIAEFAPSALANERLVSFAEAALLLCVGFVVFHVIAGVLHLFATLIFVRVGLQALLCLRTELYAYLHMLPLKFHDARRSSDSSFRVAYDSQSIQSFYSKGTFIFSTAFTFISTLIVMWRLDPQLTLLSLSVIPVMIGAIYIYSSRIRAESTAIQERESAVLTSAQEGLSAVKMVQAFGREDYEVQQFRRSADQSLHANLRLTGTTMKSSLVVGCLMALSTALVFYVGSQHVLAGTLALSSLIAISYLLVMLYQPLDAVTNLAWALESAAAAAQRCFEVLDREDDVKDAPDAQTIHSAHGQIVFDNVNFGYHDPRVILTGINLRIDAGQTVAFVGSTGAGKSTLLSLVPRFYDPSVGSVLLDGVDLRRLTKKSLRHQMSIVLQDTLLFSTTVRENIAYGRPEASEAEIIEAARRAQAHEFIVAMADGYSAQVGERGGHLSVGQRQRIGIARAFLKNAPILLLDEPTSALDSTTESAIMQVVEELMRGRTTLIITHRIATVHRLEKIVVLRDGMIVEQGKGPELVTRGGAYADLYRSANLGVADDVRV